MSFQRQSAGLVGSLFVSACCLGAGPILAALAAALGFSAFSSILNIYVLGPLMTLSVLWIVWNLHTQGHALRGAARRYAPFWVGLLGGGVAWVGVLLPPLVAGARSLGMALIIAGMAVLVAASIWSLVDQRKARPKRVSPSGGVAEPDRL
ncbi:hypothetical protein [Salinisphaera orenii]|uniref:hypothetical protein n=1 Tax=Salinisphaera orenii TaxID=856731 RepID=UPI000DBE0596